MRGIVAERPRPHRRCRSALEYIADGSEVERATNRGHFGPDCAAGLASQRFGARGAERQVPRPAGRPFAQSLELSAILIDADDLRRVAGLASGLELGAE